MGPGTFTKNVAVIPMIRAAIPTILLVLAPAAGRGQGPAASAPAPYGATPSARQRAWHEREIYGFVHFTINTFTDREWGQGDEAESLFAPTALDCQQWARVAKEAGLRGLILTAKHHDGFCLWPSAFTEHSVTRSPWKGGKGDVVRELSEACQRNGLAFGVYLSPWDRNHKDYGRPEYLTYYRSQLKELLTGYGPLFEVWFDGANGGDGYYGGAREKRVIDASHYYDWSNTTKIVRELQPGAVMFSDAGPDVRWVGNERGTAGETTWQTFDLAGHFAGHEHPKQTEGHRAGDTWLPPETDVSIRPGWFHHTSEDSKVKTAKQLVDIYFESVGRGSNLLLNIPPIGAASSTRTTSSRSAGCARSSTGSSPTIWRAGNRPRRAARAAAIPTMRPRERSTATRRPTGRPATRRPPPAAIGSRSTSARPRPSTWSACARRSPSASGSTRSRSTRGKMGSGAKSPRGQASARVASCASRRSPRKSCVCGS